jgi:hypothetical protein
MASANDALDEAQQWTARDARWMDVQRGSFLPHSVKCDAFQAHESTSLLALPSDSRQSSTRQCERRDTTLATVQVLTLNTHEAHGQSRRTIRSGGLQTRQSIAFSVHDSCLTLSERQETDPASRSPSTHGSPQPVVARTQQRWPEPKPKPDAGAEEKKAEACGWQSEEIER